jgi:flagella basal body P-ring formation protein FlgA
MHDTRSYLEVSMLAAVALLAAGARAAQPGPSSLEALLRARRPEIVRWETQPLETRAHKPVSESGIVKIGHVGPRTPVRFADGRQRWFAVAGFAPVLLSKRAIEAGALVNAEDTLAAERDVIALGCAPLMDIGHGGRLRATRRLSSGEVICSNSVQPVPEIQRDRPVLLSTQRGPVSASRVLTATADANAGERVRLRDPASGDTVIAIVTGPGFARDPDSQEQK